VICIGNTHNVTHTTELTTNNKTTTNIYHCMEWLTEEARHMQLQGCMQEEFQLTSYSQADQGQKLLPLSLKEDINFNNIVNSNT
jgi:hypothetical protein